jgi:ParB/Sulfiredoxin domain
MAHCGPLLELADVQRRLHLAASNDRGLQTISVGDIVGTEDRCCDFDRCFHPLRQQLTAGVAALERAFPSGDYPPIDVAQVDRAYFVIDGHKRVAAARASGVDYIDAHVTHYATRHRLDSTIGVQDLDLLEASERFLTETRLGLARPRADLRCLSARGYAELLEAVKAHGHDLIRAREQLVPREEVAGHWHDCDFVPTLRAAREAGLTARLACCPPGELYLILHRQAQILAGASCGELDRAAAANAHAAALTQRPRRRIHRRPDPR